MNYVSHTRAAHQQLASQADARPQHVSLYWALFFAWNAARFPTAMPLDREALMRASHIGNKDTLTTTLQTLDRFGLIAYQPSKVNGASRVVVVRFDQEHTPEVGQPHTPEVGDAKTVQHTPEVGQPHTPELGDAMGGAYPSSGGTLLIVKTSSIDKHDINVGGGTKKNRKEGCADDRLSGAEVLDENVPPSGAVPQPPDGPGTAPKEKVAPKRKGVPEPATADNLRRKATSRQRKPEVRFADSELATYEQFAAAFAGTDYELADLRFYHEKVKNWRQQGEEPRRRDWKATATQFFLNDAQDNRLKLAPGVQHHNGSNAASGQPGGPAAEYRSSRWD
ncbi:hypothetical protein [Hymenobacter rubripertinctus]|uniref:hypothetical protein n=1 Tax=Hymenobacter rubripertinctus TaxID=2029981 RepID=UPI0011C40FFE|nr:hypothetical protein [Hymenobacter rubripertinctus]